MASTESKATHLVPRPEAAREDHITTRHTEGSTTQKTASAAHCSDSTRRRCSTASAEGRGAPLDRVTDRGLAFAHGRVLRPSQRRARHITAAWCGGSARGYSRHWRAATGGALLIATELDPGGGRKSGGAQTE
eukprot:TRINITY_DN504_c4_g1_i2.p3 TRINITY_DN504_c4_g1~~TRINITY_DN504_c4_g1_i2.p3  ORF type:complete len:133 (+),score=13.88 TRINITY_DN504_c4_g1_i2:164-562(+)